MKRFNCFSFLDLVKPVFITLHRLMGNDKFQGGAIGLLTLIVYRLVVDHKSINPFWLYSNQGV